MESENRVVVLIDMDCFYCQVEEKLNPELKGKPIAVVQYNPWKGGGIIAVNYVARARGVSRHMRGDEAKEKCPEIELPSVPCLRGKADITKYRDAGKDVAKVLQKFTPLLERASIDEAYLDITSSVHEKLKKKNINAITTESMPNTFALGYESIQEFVNDVQAYGSGCMEFDYENAQMLLMGAVIVSEIRAAVYEETGYRCSAGIAHNKILAKLVCGMNKPNKQTILPKHSINVLYKTLSVKKVKHLGGKFGDTVCELLRIKNMGQLQEFTEKELQTKFDEKNGTWLYNIARGIDLEPVQAKFNPKSIGCCKQFKGKAALLDLNSLKKWLKDLGDEIEDRLEKDSLENSRIPKQMVVSFSVQLTDGSDGSSSRSYNFVPEDDLGGELFTRKALELLLDSAEGVKPKDGEGDRKLKAPIKFLGISVGKFEDISDSKKTKKILDYFTAAPTKSKEDMPQEKIQNKKNIDKDFIFKKFFQSSDTTNKNNKICNASKLNKDENNKTNDYETANTNVGIEASLDKQESFFAQFLKQKTNHNATENIMQTSSSAMRPTTPQCNVVEHGDDSNDTDYSGSTINMEINKSIALFEDDPTDVERVSSMRQLLNPSSLHNPHETVHGGVSETATGLNNAQDVAETEIPETETVHQDVLDTQQISDNDFECPQCKKRIAINMVETHADYHLALSLRDEERRQRREERLHRNQVPETKTEKEKKLVVEAPKVESNTATITSFLVKLNDNIPSETCTECGKKISIEKFAEHLDFHAAQKLNRELNRKASSTSYFTGNSVKRKRKSLSPVKKSKVPCKSIDSFFR